MLATKPTKTPHHAQLPQCSRCSHNLIRASYVSLLLPELLQLRLPLIPRRTQEPIQYLPPLLGHINNRLIQRINDKPIRYTQSSISHIQNNQTCSKRETYASNPCLHHQPPTPHLSAPTYNTHSDAAAPAYTARDPACPRRSCPRSCVRSRYWPGGCVACWAQVGGVWV